MKPCAILSFLILLLISACNPADRQPVFSARTLPEATSIPMPAKAPQPAATLAQRIASFDVGPGGRSGTPTYVALATSAGVQLYDLQTLKYVRSLNQGEWAASVAWSPDGTKLAVGSAKDYGQPFYVGGDSSNSWKAHLTVWDTSSWKIIFEPQYGNEMVNQNFRAMAWSPDSRRLQTSATASSRRIARRRSAWPGLRMEASSPPAAA